MAQSIESTRHVMAGERASTHEEVSNHTASCEAVAGEVERPVHYVRCIAFPHAARPLSSIAVEGGRWAVLSTFRVRLHVPYTRKSQWINALRASQQHATR